MITQILKRLEGHTQANTDIAVRLSGITTEFLEGCYASSLDPMPDKRINVEFTIEMDIFS